jgi:hypothetical protein
MNVLESVVSRCEHACRRYLRGKIGWGGRIRTFTILINSEVSYRLDHAPAVLCETARGKSEAGRFRCESSGMHELR